MKQGKGEEQRPSQIITRLPFEDLRELWYWGTWKELVPDGFSTTVIIACTSRDACLRYLKRQHNDNWLLVDTGEAEAEKLREAPSEPGDAIFDAGRGPHRRGTFKLMTFVQFVAAVKKDAKNKPRVSVLINPRKEGGLRVVTDAIYTADALLEALGERRSSQK